MVPKDISEIVDSVEKPGLKGGQPVDNPFGRFVGAGGPLLESSAFRRWVAHITKAQVETLFL